MKEIKLLSNLRRPLYFSIFLAASMVTFSVSYFMMATLPGERDNMCVIGGGLTLSNMAFAVILSLSIGIMFAGFAEMVRAKARQKLAVTSLSGVSFILGAFTFFCTLCTIPLISFFGISIALWVFSEYILLFQTISLIFMGIALVLMERQLRGICFTGSLKQKIKQLFSLDF